MMRDNRLKVLREDWIKKTLRAGRPEPPPMFSNRLHRTLDKLPAWKPRSAKRFIPISAVAVAAFAVFCIFLTKYAGQPNEPGGNQPAMEGTQTMQPATASPDAGLPTSDIALSATPGATPEVTASGATPALTLPPTPSPDTKFTGTLEAVASGASIDLDGDGTAEKITYSAPDEEHIVVKAGGKTWNINGFSRELKAFVGDIDASDGVLDLFVEATEVSDDFTTYVASYKNGAFIDRGSLPCAASRIYLGGKKILQADKRMHILMTWFYPVKYELDASGVLQLVPQDWYSFAFTTQTALTTKVDIKLKDSPKSTATAHTVPAGTKVKLIDTDDEKWVEIETPDFSGFLEMADYFTLKDPNIAGYDAFEGLNMAD